MHRAAGRFGMASRAVFVGSAMERITVAARRLTRRVLLAGGTAATSLALLSACGATASAPPGTASGAPRATALGTPSAGPRTTTPVSGNVTIEAWIFGNTGSDVNAESRQTAAIIEAFNQANRGQIAVRVNPIANPDTEYQAKILSAAAAHQLPDLLQLDGPFVASYAYSQLLAPLDPYFTPDDLRDFVPSIIEQGAWQGHLWSLGAFSSSMGVMVNKKLVEAAGLTIPTSVAAAWDWPTFAAAARRLTRNGVSGLDLHMDYGVSDWFTYLMSTFIWSNGGDLLAPDRSQADGAVNGPAAVEVMTEFQRLFKEGVVSATPDPVAFEQGQVAFQIIGAWVIEGFKDFPDLDWTIMPLPYFKQRVSPSGSYTWGLGAQGQRRDAAAELLRWLVATDTGIVPIVQTNKLPPARTSAYPKLPFYASLPYSLYAEQLQTTARARPITPAYPVLTAKFAQAVSDIALGAPVKESLDTVAHAVDDDIKRHHGYQS
jgi:fructooligosaccharide transport system substrate-binding protein